jgi:hypothetical protein
MSNREESLRRILDAALGDRRLTEDQRREIVAHLDDSVETKVAGGVPEVEAVASAFLDLGDLRKIARQFPTPPAAVTPEGATIVASVPTVVWTAYALLVFFLTLQTYVTPRFTEIFQRVKVPLPSLTVFFVSISQAVQGAPAIVLLVLAGLAAALVHFRRRRFLPRAVLAMGVASFALCIGLVAALSLPFLTILQGVGGR